MIAQHSIESLKNQIDIVDIIGNSIELSRSGANFKAPCPFHDEKTASFVVSPRKQICHCFGCAAGGDAIWFVQELFKLSYPEAIEHIANDMNFTLEYKNTGEKKDYKKIMETIGDYYRTSLSGKELEYLHDRGVSDESIKRFEIGFAGASKPQVDHLNKHFLNLNDACDIGVLAKGEHGLYSRLINRITFPIRNHAGKLIGFGGRTTTGHAAKYVNSPQTKLFDKSRNLFGFSVAKEHVYKKGTIVITEGYMDVIMMHQAGVRTAVATLGTALTSQHIPVIKKAGCRVLLCYDGDKAGREAAYKASALLSRNLIDGGVVLFGEGVDPADMVAEGKKDELISHMKKPQQLIAYALRYIAAGFDLSNPIEQDKAKNECIKFLNSLPSPVVAEGYRAEAAAALGIDVKYIHLQRSAKPKQPKPQPKQSAHNANIELSLIATADQDENARGFLYETDPDIFTLHKKELNALLDGQDVGFISLKDDIVIFDIEEFKTQLSILLADSAAKEIKKVRGADIPAKDKIARIKQLQKRIAGHKRGDLAIA